ncbi:hypothetical protein, partial [Heyndrickxia ginsengihumi]|uniref:hypothetical protein n=1 Tax=Heyndrickxia ginsengihumi TaxID=363870 RepID=UPI003D1AEE2D
IIRGLSMVFHFLCLLHLIIQLAKISKIMSRLTSLAHITQGTTKKTTSIHHSQVKNSFFSQPFNSK